MAGKKKAKKAQSNPARGFATTSSISKSKADAQDEPAVAEPCNGVEESSVASHEPGSNQKADARAEPDLSELTPDQLEARMEESELQIQIETHREKAKRDASRYVSRLKTDRKLLRASAERLYHSSWITEEMMSDAIERIRVTPYDVASSTSTASLIGEEDLTVRLWTLQRALIDLGFSQDAVRGALAQLLKDVTGKLKSQAPGSKETLWGADESLEYFALHLKAGELPDYDDHRTEPDRLYEAVMDGVTSEALSGDVNSAQNLDAVGPIDSKPLPVKRESESTLQPAARDEDARGSDSDIEPQDQMRKYLEFKTRLFRRRPDLTREKPRKGKKSKIQNDPPKEPPDRPTAKLLQRIRKLERDLLFDSEAANAAWLELQITLEAEAAALRRLDKEEVRPPQNEQPMLNSKEPSEDNLSDHIGDLFLGLPEEPQLDASENNLTTTESNGSKMTVRSFGTWTGLNPRRVLEEACKARDPGSKINLSQLASTAFSSRHKLHIRWKQNQKPSAPINIPGLSCRWDQKAFIIEMANVSCSDKGQSEAFVSTAALFLIFSSSPKEEKVYIRLPTVWRALWSEFVELKQQHQDAHDRQRFREVRDMVREHQANHHSGTANAIIQAQTAGDFDVAPFEALPKFEVESIAAAETLTQLWKTNTLSASYDEMLLHRQNLPIWSFKEKLLKEISLNQTIILCGETGCGKSTQVPAFILEHELCAGRNCKIYCTQPRRISAISLARRVSEELGEGRNALGTVRSLVGYAIRLESRVTSMTRLVYATTGVLMRMLENNNDLRDITHIVIDEVHERTIDSDFLLIILRRLMTTRAGLKVILMSATVDAEHFSRYLGGAPIINVPGRTYPVETKFLEDAIEVTGYGSGSDHFQKKNHDDSTEDESSSREAGDLSSYSARTRHVLSEINEYRIDYELTVRLLETIATDDRFQEYSEAILVFLPGIAEIRRLNDILSAQNTFSHGWLIYPLHSTISTEEQEQAFRIPPQGVRKIVLATNIAETGITIPDITCVVDSGKHREMRFDEKRQLSRLLEAFISRANAKQRRGRAGRVQKGLCFHLFTRVRHDQIMADSQTPEMLRLSLQDLALRVKICNLGGIETVLADALDPPLPRNVRRAIESLADVKALTETEELTALGRQLAKLPLDVYLGKMIIMSCTFNCVDAGLSIAAILSSKSPFLTPINSQSQAREARLAFKRGDSDLLTAYNAYCSWRRVCETKATSEFQFCRKNFLSHQTLSNIEDLKNQLAVALIDAGFLKLDPKDTDTLQRARHSSRRRFVRLPLGSNCNSENEVVVNAVIALSFYPKLLIREGKGYRNLANNQIVSLHPSSINKGTTTPPKFLSFYHIMQSASRYYHAHETNAVDDMSIALLCGEADSKLFAGILSVDNNRLRFAITDWTAMVIMKVWRAQLRKIVDQGVDYPGRELSNEQRYWFDLWQTAFSKRDNGKRG